VSPRIAALAACLLTLAAPSAEAATSIPAEAWQHWRSRFVSTDGRVIDDGNGGISHSEGQGYGMLFAAFAGDRPAFDRLWSWTVRNLGLRDDALFAWKWDPKATPPVADSNDAADGDMLIAWALAEAADRFAEPAYRRDAAIVARSIAGELVVDGAAGRLLMPAVSGFSERDRRDGPVVNLSYWVFPALKPLARVAPEYDWAALGVSGVELAVDARFGPARLASDWISLKGEAKPAAGFAAEFGWNAIRVPLYLAWAGETGEALAPYLDWAKSAGPEPALVDLDSGKAARPFGGPGYAAVPALLACVSQGRRLDAAIANAPMDLYYPSTLRLLVLAAAAERYPKCL
jgi:endoglucanase